ncbi:phosphotransacetylase family protein [Geothermobacter hydrogeniphilus]|uniref:Cobyrinic acid a,c-diamide synthase n=1 Tax=Geothermobacter hydrogeniphilus TaxID=1969733 RepID=A0A1X0YEE8_9BACT|nr:AAA family ATPase [Geothermobacter hydrogeniphilus]ORJ63463.1 cobyrinic acid a,c-diamide synthase [Geothermobacter hydrogeniphilus]
MARKIFIAATSQNCGKTTTSLSLMHMARKKYPRVGFIKPIGPKPVLYRGLSADKDAVVMARVFGLEDDLRLMSPFVLQPGDTRRVLDGKIDRGLIAERMLEAIEELDAKNDFLIIEGAGHPGVGSLLGCNNARLAAESGAAVMLVTGGGLGNVVDSVCMNLALFEKEQVDVRAVLVNKIIPDKRERTLDYLERAFADHALKLIGGFNYQPILANPTLRRIAGVLDIELHADEEEAQRIVHHVQLGAASAQRVAGLLQDSTLVIVNSSRDELIVTLANLYQIPEWRTKLAGIIIPGTGEVSAISQQIIETSGIPYMRAGRTSTRVFEIIKEDVSKLTAEDTHKIALISELAEKRFDFEAIDALFDQETRSPGRPTTSNDTEHL